MYMDIMNYTKKKLYNKATTLVTMYSYVLSTTALLHIIGQFVFISCALVVHGSQCYIFNKMHS